MKKRCSDCVHRDKPIGVEPCDSCMNAFITSGNNFSVKPNWKPIKPSFLIMTCKSSSGGRGKKISSIKLDTPEEFFAKNSLEDVMRSTRRPYVVFVGFDDPPERFSKKLVKTGIFKEFTGE